MGLWEIRGSSSNVDKKKREKYLPMKKRFLEWEVDKNGSEK